MLTVRLVFQNPTDAENPLVMVLHDPQWALIPTDSDMVWIGDRRHRILFRTCTFHPDRDMIEIYLQTKLFS
jgi:hypothetical protein